LVLTQNEILQIRNVTVEVKRVANTTATIGNQVGKKLFGFGAGKKNEKGEAGTAGKGNEEPLNPK
jgi:hypothetical protein